MRKFLTELRPLDSQQKKGIITIPTTIAAGDFPYFVDTEIEDSNVILIYGYIDKEKIIEKYASIDCHFQINFGKDSGRIFKIIFNPQRIILDQIEGFLEIIESKSPDERFRNNAFTGLFVLGQVLETLTASAECSIVVNRNLTLALKEISRRYLAGRFSTKKVTSQ